MAESVIPIVAAVIRAAQDEDREAIARDIESMLDNSESDDIVLEAARIARGFTRADLAAHHDGAL